MCITGGDSEEDWIAQLQQLSTQQFPPVRVLELQVAAKLAEVEFDRAIAKELLP